jgi:hypothetical protein
MSTVGNGTTGASGTGPASGYNLVLSHLLVVFFLFLYRLTTNTSNPYAATMLLIFTHSMICFIIFEIKIYHKMPKNLTVIIIVCGMLISWHARVIFNVEVYMWPTMVIVYGFPHDSVGILCHSQVVSAATSCHDQCHPGSVVVSRIRHLHRVTIKSSR